MGAPVSQISPGAHVKVQDGTARRQRRLSTRRWRRPPRLATDACFRGPATSTSQNRCEVVVAHTLQWDGPAQHGAPARKRAHAAAAQRGAEGGGVAGLRATSGTACPLCFPTPHQGRPRPNAAVRGWRQVRLFQRARVAPTRRPGGALWLGLRTPRPSSTACLRGAPLAVLQLATCLSAEASLPAARRSSSRLPRHAAARPGRGAQHQRQRQQRPRRRAVHRRRLDRRGAAQHRRRLHR